MILSALQILTGFSVTYFSLKSLPVEWFLFHAPHSLEPEGGVKSSLFPIGTFYVSAASRKLFPSACTTPFCYCLHWPKSCFSIYWSPFPFIGSTLLSPSHSPPHILLLSVALTSTRRPTSIMVSSSLFPYHQRTFPSLHLICPYPCSHCHPHLINCHYFNSEISPNLSPHGYHPTILALFPQWTLLSDGQLFPVCQTSLDWHNFQMFLSLLLLL